MCLATRGFFSCSILPSFRTISSSVKTKALVVNKNVVTLPVLKAHVRRTSTYKFQASVSQITTCEMTFHSKQLTRVQSLYKFGSLTDFVKRTDRSLGSKRITSMTARYINTKSKLGKRKSCKAVTKRFIRTGKGKLKRWRAGKNHKMMNKGPKRSMRLRKPTYANKQQLKLLNKMLSGW